MDGPLVFFYKDDVMVIESTHNETVKRARSLRMKKERELRALHMIEGERMLREALQAGVCIEEVFLQEGHSDTEAALNARGIAWHLVSRSVLESLADTKTPQWVCACVKTPPLTPPSAFPSGLIVALDAVQDPGNLGTIIRTADALGAQGVLLGKGCCDAFSPKTLRATMGSVYHLPIWECALEETLRGLAADGFTLLCAHLSGKEELPRLQDKCVLVIGNEGNGVCEAVSSLCSLYRLPMPGKAESLNASVAAGILIYEVTRHMKM